MCSIEGGGGWQGGGFRPLVLEPMEEEGSMAGSLGAEGALPSALRERHRWPLFLRLMEEGS